MTRFKPNFLRPIVRLAVLRAVAFLAILLIGLPSAHGQRRTVDLEVQVDTRAPVGTQQEWAQALQNVGADSVRVKSGRATTPAVEELELSSSTILSVTGSIKGGKLHLPGGKFSIRETAKIKALLNKLRDDGAKVALADKKAFGLTSEQLVALHGTLGKTVNFSTKDVESRVVVNKISELLGVTLHLDRAGSLALRGSAPVADELNGISAGTALAVVARPLGLVFSPTREQGKQTQLRIVDSATAEENWPIGWPISQPPVQVEPKLYERLKLEIRGFPLSDAMNAIQKRTDVPFFYDYNSMARHGVEMSKSKVTLVRDKVSFSVAIMKLLSQSKPTLVDELRIDENGKAFLWITTINK